MTGTEDNQSPTLSGGFVSERNKTALQDATPLYDAARALLGYFLYAWYGHFLGFHQKRL